MARTTIEAIDAIMNESSSVIQRNAALSTATAMVDNVFSTTSHSSTILTQIELWLGAHFVALMTRQKTSQSAGKASVSYQSQIGKKLELTHYGQQAILLDTEGKLAQLQETKKKASFLFVGSDVSHELTSDSYDEYGDDA